jgi:hypothetical protein
MRRRTPTEVLRTVLVAGLLLGFIPDLPVYAQQPGAAQQQGGLTAQQAAAKAVAAHGGKVLKVTRQGNGYRVKLLQDSGRVVTVTVKD